MNEIKVPSLFFEDIAVGMEFDSPGRTVTEADLVAFSGLSGDYNQLHTDDVFASATRHGGRIAHGTLVIAIVSGLSSRSVLMLGLADQIIGLLSLDCRFKIATKIGDTLRVVLRVENLKTTSDGKRGVLTLSRTAYNQFDTVVMESSWTLLLKSRSDVE